MNELQLKLERRRKSMADVESGARLDEAVSSQKNGPSGASATVSAAQKEMLDKLDRRRRLNEQGDLGDCNPSVTEPLEPVADALSSNEVGGADAVSKVSAIESGASSAAVSEIDSISYSSRRPPVPKVADKSHRPPPVPPEALPAPDITPLALNSPSQDNIFSSSSAAASIVLPWNSGIYTLRDRKTPEKADNSNTGLIEAQAKQHKRRQSFKIKALYEFNAEEALQQASIDTLMAIVNEFQLELGPGAFLLAIRKMHGQRAVAKLRSLNASTDTMCKIILDLAAEMGIDAYKDAIEQHYINTARDAAASETPRGSECMQPGEVGRGSMPFLIMSCCHETGKWSIPEDAASLIADIMASRDSSAPLKVIGAIGAIRKGKSFFLNRVAGRQTGFEVGGDATQSCTEGIWLWFKPGSDVVLVDTAGMFDSRRRNKKLDEQLFLCTAVLSSFLIYNSTGSVDQHALCNFGDSAGLAKKLFQKMQKTRRGVQPKPEGTLPPLMWLIRDFSMSLTQYDGSGDVYLQKQLQPVKDDYTDNLITVMNEARETVKGLFPDIKCVTMSKPFVSKEMLSHLDAYPFQSLPADFQLSVNSAADAARTAAPFKKFYKLPNPEDESAPPEEMSATPQILLYYAEALVCILNGDLPMDMNSLWRFVYDRVRAT